MGLYGLMSQMSPHPQPRTAPQKINPKLNFFEKYLSVWVLACMAVGIGLGRVAPDLAIHLEQISVYQVSLPIAVCLFFMMYPIMVKIDFFQAKRALQHPKPVLLTLVINWLIKPWTMLIFAQVFLGHLFRPWLTGTEILRGQAVPLVNSYIAGTILLGIAPCTAMVMLWGYLAYGNQGHTLIMVAINSLVMLVLYAPLGQWLLHSSHVIVPWETIVLSVLIYVGLPLVTAAYSRHWILKHRGSAWLETVFFPYLTPVAIAALLLTLILLFSFKGNLILESPLIILLIAIPLTLQTIVIFGLGYVGAWKLNINYEDAAPAALIGASNHFEVAIATAITLFGISSGAALATVVGVLIEVPLMLLLVKFCQATAPWFPRDLSKATLPDPRY